MPEPCASDRWSAIEEELDLRLDRFRAQLLGEFVSDTVVVPACPVDKPPACSPKRLSQPVIALVLRLGARLPLVEAAAVLAETRGIAMDHDTVRRWTEATGRMTEADTDEGVAAYYARSPASPPGPDLQVVSVDGAKVSLQLGA